MLVSIKALREDERNYRQKAIEIKTECAPEELYEIIVSKKGLAITDAFLGNTTDAIENIDEVLTFYQRTTGEDSEYVANTYTTMCMIYEKAGRLQESRKFGRKAIEMLIKLYGADFYGLINAYHNTEFTCERMGLKDEADGYRKERERLERGYGER